MLGSGDNLHRQRHPKSLWSDLGLNLLSLLHQVALEVPPRRMYEQLNKYWCIYLRRKILVRGRDSSFDRGDGADEGLVVVESCIVIYGVGTSVVLSYCEMRVFVVVRRYVFVAALCLGYL